MVAPFCWLPGLVQAWDWDLLENGQEAGSLLHSSNRRRNQPVSWARLALHRGLLEGQRKELNPLRGPAVGVFGPEASSSPTSLLAA